MDNTNTPKYPPHAGLYWAKFKESGYWEIIKYSGTPNQNNSLEITGTNWCFSLNRFSIISHDPLLNPEEQLNK